MMFTPNGHAVATGKAMLSREVAKEVAKEVAREMAMEMAMEMAREVAMAIAMEMARGVATAMGGKGKLRKGNYMPKAGDMLYFHPSKRHAFYDAFPCGNQIEADDLEINLDHPIYVVETSSATLDVENTWWGPRKMDYVAVSFVTVSGQVVWTNLSRNGTLWMRMP